LKTTAFPFGVLRVLGQHGRQLRERQLAFEVFLDLEDDLPRLGVDSLDLGRENELGALKHLLQLDRGCDHGHRRLVRQEES
jgi:hypothetical protein